MGLQPPPFARGETYANGDSTILDTNNPLNAGGLGGINLQGQEYVFTPNAGDAETGYPTVNDPCGRPIHAKVVRNLSGVNLKPGRLVHYKVDDANGYEVSVDGYCYELADRPAGIVDEYLPPAGVVPNDLFYIIIEGSAQVTQPATAASATVGARLVPAAAGSGRTDDAAGRVALQDLTGATATLGNNIQNQIGFAAATNSTNNAQYNAVVHLGGE